MKVQDPPGKDRRATCGRSADCTCGQHPKPPPADETCRLVRVRAQAEMKLEVWSCSAPDPRPAQGNFTLGVFKRGEPIPAPSIWPGSSEAWSCNTPVWPGHVDLVLYEGGPEVAERTREAILAWEEAQEARRAANEAAAARAALLRGGSVESSTTRPTPCPTERQQPPRVRAKKAPEAAKTPTEPSSEDAPKPFEAFLQKHRFRKSFRIRLGRRMRHVFHVSVEATQQEGALFTKAGWYVNTVRPPADWMSNEALGPYATPEALLREMAVVYFQEDQGG